MRSAIRFVLCPRMSVWLPAGPLEADFKAACTPQETNRGVSPSGGHGRFHAFENPTWHRSNHLTL